MKKQRRRLKRAAASTGSSSSSSDSEEDVDVGVSKKEQQEEETTLGDLIDCVPHHRGPQSPPGRSTRRQQQPPPQQHQHQQHHQHQPPQQRTPNKGRLLRASSSGSDSTDSDAELDALIASASASQPALAVQAPASVPRQLPPPSTPAVAPDSIAISSSSSDSEDDGGKEKKRRRIRRGSQGGSQPSQPPSPPLTAPRARAAFQVATPPPPPATSSSGAGGGGGGSGGSRRRFIPPSASHGGEQAEAVLRRARGWAQGRLSQLHEEEEQEEEEEEGYEDDDSLASFFTADEDDGQEDGPVRCVCGEDTYDKERDAELLFVRCTNEECECWVHGRCFGIQREGKVPHKFRCHVCDPKGKSRRSIVPPSHGTKARRRGKRKRATAADLQNAQELYGRLERPHWAWGRWSGTDEEREEDEELGQLVRGAVDRWGFAQVATRLREPYKSSKFTLLMAAAGGGRVAAVRALLDAEVSASSSSSSAGAAEGASLVCACDAEGRTAAHHAVGAEEASEAAVVAILKRMLEAVGGEGLLTRRDTAGRNLLHLAATRGGGDEKDDGQADSAAAAAAATAAASEKTGGQVMRFLLQALGPCDAAALAAQDSGVGGPPLAVACRQGGEAECLALLEVTPPVVVGSAEADPEGEGAPALFEAVGRGLRRVAGRMIAVGGAEMLRKTNRKRESALHVACQAGDAATAALVLDACPELLEAPTEELCYPLHYAAAAGEAACVVELLRRGARVDVQDDAGWSPLLYADFAGREECVLSLLGVRPESQLALLGQLLAGPRRHDRRVVQLLRSLTAVPSFSRFINAFVRRHMELLDSSLSFLLEDGAQLLDLATKTAYLSQQLEAVRDEARQEEQGERRYLSSDSDDDEYEYEEDFEALQTARVLRLPREGCWSELALKCRPGRRALPPSPAAYLRRKIQLQFVGCPGVGPGVEREVFEVLAQGMVDPRSGILDLAPDHGSYLPRLPVTPEEEVSVGEGFYAAGLLAAHCLLYGKTLAVNFNACFLKLVLLRDTKLSDLQDLDADFHRHLEHTLQHDGAEHLCLAFTQPKHPGVEGHEAGEVELCPGGRDRAVTDANKEEFARLVLRHRTEGVYGPAALAMRRGMCDVLLDRHGLLLGLYTPLELGTVIGGIQDLDVGDWEAHAVYRGYDPSSPPIKWFWAAVRGLAREERALLLKFCTGASRVPVGGFAKLYPRFAIQRASYSRTRPLPTSSTCFNLLKLPWYPDASALEKSLLLAIRFGAEGFAFS